MTYLSYMDGTRRLLSAGRDQVGLGWIGLDWGWIGVGLGLDWSWIGVGLGLDWGEASPCERDLSVKFTG